MLYSEIFWAKTKLSGSMEIKGLNKQALNEFIHSKEFGALTFLPISKHRALSHIKNPRAEKNDQLLFLAYIDQHLVGYLGVLADQLYSNGKSFKCGWFSCLWIDPQQRGKNIAMQLLHAALTAWDNQMLITEYTPAAERLYDKSKAFQAFIDKDGIRLYRRFELHRILPPKRKFLSELKPLLKLMDAALNVCVDTLIQLNRKTSSKSSYKIIENFDQESKEFMQSMEEYNCFQRSLEDLNWIIQFPWILSAPEDEWSKKYHFSSVDKRFNFKVVKVYNEAQTLCALLLLSIRDQHLRIPYLYHKEGIAAVAECLKEIMCKERINTLSCYHNELTKYFEHVKRGVIHKKPIKRSYLITKKLAEDSMIEHPNIQDGDGDCSFT